MLGLIPTTMAMMMMMMPKVGDGRARDLLQEDEEEDFLDEATVMNH